MHSNYKKLIAGSLAVLMVMYTLPMNAYAADSESEAEFIEEAAEEIALPDYMVTDEEDSLSNEQIVFNFLTQEMGCNSAVAAGIMGNIAVECSFNPTADSGSFYGLCQWGGARRSRLFSWCNENGYDPKTVKGQLYYIQYELLGSESGAWSHMQNIPDTADGAVTAARNWAVYYERCASWSVKLRTARTSSTYWPLYGGTIELSPEEQILADCSTLTEGLID